MKLVRDSFSPEDAEYILSIPPSSHEDALCWHFDKLGKFSVKSAYWLASQNPDLARSSSPAPLASWWRSLWLLNLPAKVRLFLWRLCHDWLPSAGSFVRRHISMAEHCHLCMGGVESIVHACWGCPLLRVVRKSRPSFAALPIDFHGSPLDFLSLCRSSFSHPDFDSFCVILWRSWFRRNSALFSGKLLPAEEIVPWSESFLSEFQTANVSILWAAPSPGWFKINSDAAVDSVNKRVSFGVVIRDSYGHILAALAEPYPVLVSVVVAEAMVIRRGLQFASALGFHPVGFESDASSAISSILNKDPPLSEVGLVISDILALVSSLSVSHISFTPRSYNGVAHQLVRFGLSIPNFLAWIEEDPPCTVDSILSDS
ncbi:hypothetical protein ACOSP7_020763 [Xanthoceras sorbifolium]